VSADEAVARCCCVLDGVHNHAGFYILEHCFWRGDVRSEVCVHMHADVIVFFPVNDNLINQSMHYTRYEQCMKRVSQWRHSVPLICSRLEKASESSTCTPCSGMMPRST